MNDDGFSKSGILLSFVVGGLAGAAVALLFAPQSGRGTRGLINQRIREGVDRGRTAKERLAGKGREVLEGASRYIGKRQRDSSPEPDRRFVVEAVPRKEEPAL